LKPFWSRHFEEDHVNNLDNSEFPKEFERPGKHRTNVWFWWTLMLLTILGLDLYILNATMWLIFFNGVAVVAAVWLVLAKMR
jgi:hypothetical protein